MARFTARSGRSLDAIVPAVARIERQRNPGICFEVEWSFPEDALWTRVKHAQDKSGTLAL
jgi:hypothetical protein